MKTFSENFRFVWRAIALGGFLAALLPAHAATFVEQSREHFGTFRGVDYVQYKGRFVGITDRGVFRVPFEIVAPADPGRGNGKVVFEPPHFAFGAFARDNVLGPDLLFGRGFSYATVGFANEGANLQDPAASDAVIAGLPAPVNAPPFPRDVEILKQFVQALDTDSMATAVLGAIEQKYAYGLSQSAEALFELFYGPGAEGLFDLTVLHVPLWRPAFARPDVLAALPENFEPLAGIGKVMLVSAEGDLLISGSSQFRNVVTHPDYRLYQVAGAPHLAQDFILGDVRTNPLDVAPVVRAAFVAGDRWVSGDLLPPESELIDAAEPNEIDPVYWMSTGIARDENLNARGGLRFPDVESGRALHVASALDVEVIPGLPGLIGFWIDLACAPTVAGRPRFRNHGDYVRQVAIQASELAKRGLLLSADRTTLVERAAASAVGKPRSCPAPQ